MEEIKSLYKIAGIVLCVVWLVLCPNPVKGSEKASDSLSGELQRLAEDTNKIKTLIKIALDLSYSDPAKGVLYGEEAKKLSEKLKWKKGIALANHNIGLNYLAISEYQKAAEGFAAALVINEEIGDKFQQGRNLGNLGIVYYNKSAYSKALEFLFKSLKAFEECNNKLGIGNQLGAIGNVYYRQKNYPKTIYYDSMAKAVFISTKDTEGIAIQLGNLGNVYESLHQYNKALQFDFEALMLFKKMNNLPGEARNLFNIGLIYNDRNQCIKGLEYVLKAYEFYKAMNNQNMIAYCLGHAGQSYILSVTRQNAKDEIKPEFISGTRTALLMKGISYMNSAYEITSTTEDISLRQFLANKLSEAYVLIGDYKSAFSFQNESIQLKDSIFNMESRIRIENLTTEREVMLKDKQIVIDRLEIQKKRNERVVFLIGIGMILVILGFVLRSFVRQKILNREIEKGKAKSDELLLNILPAEIAEELKDKGSAMPRHYDSVTVLFTDFKDFTQTSEKMQPAELVGEIDFMYSEFDLIISKHNIEKIKTIGDSYMCAGGIPEPSDLSACNAVGAALEIRDFISNTALQRQSQNRPVFKVRIGLHTGPVVAGIVGIKKFAYDIWGDAVNLASRMESSGEEGMVNISSSTYEMVKDKFDCEYRGKITAKHKGEIDMYFVKGKKTPDLL